ncbi:hypothetical protein G4B88_011253 [Cannabis sativa]|uniref:Uncharacterized protein n=1 Tax=Cannabis sativa TaxID=3483 RepID=A0A7J6DP62_CANSA|nr:hypothetical protein G4B88_011253 [Cannabis sativa]
MDATMGGRHRPDLGWWRLGPALLFLVFLASGRRSWLLGVSIEISLARGWGSQVEPLSWVAMTMVLFRRVLGLWCVYILGLLFICLGSGAQWKEGLGFTLKRCVSLVSLPSLFRTTIRGRAWTFLIGRWQCSSAREKLGQNLGFLLGVGGQGPSLDLGHGMEVEVLTKSLSPWYGVWGLAQVRDRDLGVQTRSEGSRSKLRSMLRFGLGWDLSELSEYLIQIKDHQSLHFMSSNSLLKGLFQLQNILPVAYLNQLSFQDFLSQAEEEFEFDIPCTEDDFIDLIYCLGA